MNRRLLPSLVCVLALAALPDCGVTQSHPKDGGSIRIADFAKASEINPITTDSSISSLLLELVFDNLVRLDSAGEIRPELAERWEITPDHLTWKFYLRKDARFHDGVPVEAADVKYTYEALIATERSGNSNAFESLREIRIPDAHLVEIVLSKPDNLLWDTLSHIGIAPKHLLQGRSDFSAFNRHPVGSGPYRFVKQDEREIVLAANKEYFGGRPRLDRVEVEILPSQKAGLTNLIAGKVDMIFLVNPNDFGALASIPTIATYENWSSLLYLLSFNLKNEFLSDPQVRRALNRAVDKKTLVDRVLGGKGTVAAGSFDLNGKDLSADVTPYPYDPEAAMKIFSERGWQDRDGDYILDKGNKKAEMRVLVMEGDNVGLKTMSILQEQLRQVGVKVAIETAPFDVYSRRIFQERGVDGSVIFFVGAHLQDNNVSLWHSQQIAGGFNFSSYADAEVDRSLDAMRFSPDPVERKKARHDFQKAIHDDPPAVFLFWRRMPIAVHKRFHGLPEKKMEMRDLVNVWESPEPRQEDGR